MPNIERVTGKIFAENASPVGNNPEIGKFGNAKQGIFTGEANISEIQNSEAWSQGWTGAIVSSNNYPPLPEMNGVLKNLSQQICYLLQHGIPEWDSETTYYTNDYVNYNGTLYFSTIDNNTTEPLTPEAGNNWKSGTVELPIATTSSIGAVQPDGVSIGVTEEGIITVLQNPIIDISHPIGDPIITLNNTLNDNEIWLEGSEISSTTYANLFNIYQYDYTPIKNLYNFNGKLNGNLNFENNFVISPTSDNDYVTTDLTLSGTSDFSIEVPIRINTRSDHSIIANFGATGVCGLLFYTASSGEKNKFGLDISSNSTSWNVVGDLLSEAVLEFNTWYMIKFSYTSSTRTYKLEYALLENYVPQEYGELEPLTNLQYEEGLTYTANADFYYSPEMTWSFGNVEPIHKSSNHWFNGYIDLSRVTPSILTPKKINTFNLPDCRNRVFWGTDESTGFGYISAGLPNIEGNSYSLCMQTRTVGLPWGEGAFNISYTRAADSATAGTGTCTGEMTFDASGSNSIYGSSQTVRPPAIKTRVKTRYQ